MLVRLLGKEDEALAGTWQTPFTDVVEWAKPYIGYAYANKLTGGDSATTFGGAADVTATQYLTFVLRALGYSSDSDFAWDKAWELTDKLGITNGQYGADSAFERGDAVIVSNKALSAKMKGDNHTLLQLLHGKVFFDEKMSLQEAKLAIKDKYRSAVDNLRSGSLYMRDGYSAVAEKFEQLQNMPVRNNQEIAAAQKELDAIPALLASYCQKTQNEISKAIANLLSSIDKSKNYDETHKIELRLTELYQALYPLTTVKITNQTEIQKLEEFSATFKKVLDEQQTNQEMILDIITSWFE